MGFVVAVGAGNDGKDACGYSPASASSAIAVGAIDNGDSFPSWSNFGGCVDILAPGAGITSITNADNFGTLQKSGTSMASPHVAGALALQYGNSQWSSAQIRNDLLSRASNGVISNVPGGTPNRALFVPSSR
jgi:subtilisin family serine protease